VGALVRLLGALGLCTVGVLFTVAGLAIGLPSALVGGLVGGLMAGCVLVLRR
jgi:uncharacterized membrane protein YkvI